MRDKQAKIFSRNRTISSNFNQEVEFYYYEQQDDDDFVTLQPDARWYMILEITTVNVKESLKIASYNVASITAAYW